MADSTIWWLITGALVVLELLSGTFYLLMLAIGTAAGALLSYTGASASVQIAVAALVGLAAELALTWWRRRQPAAGAIANRAHNINLDVGEIIQVSAWQPDGTAQVRYRGANWTALRAPGSEALPGDYRVTELVGSRLLVEKV